MLDVEYAQLSDPGRERVNNEDYLDCAGPADPESDEGRGWLFALADGVGGHENGEVASREAVRCVVSGFRAAADKEMLSALIPRLVQAANAAVYELGANARRGAPSMATSMATTLVACGIKYDSAVIAHVGDSRCYRIRRGIAEVLTRDHTLAGEQARLGIVPAGEAQTSRNRQVLTRSIGQDLIANIDLNEERLSPGDVLMLCSDGLHHSVPEPEIAAIVAEHRELPQAARELVALANRRDGSDNISVQLIRIRDVERVGMYRGRPYKLR